MAWAEMEGRFGADVKNIRDQKDRKDVREQPPHA